MLSKCSNPRRNFCLNGRQNCVSSAEAVWQATSRRQRDCDTVNFITTSSTTTQSKACNNYQPFVASLWRLERAHMSLLAPQCPWKQGLPHLHNSGTCDTNT